jgi:DNA polymerase zeta
VTLSQIFPNNLIKFQVYLPCVLLAKKRYVGFKYESPDDLEPAFEAKGIETVRRDGCAAQAKMLETCLK